ncbi:hypothetical protein BDZ89DRAFT_1138478 [Hymenopellis radicata]|nr:hypothetical protein BDZ89DRAFT_1138478 [Hymenopellis radicata]
MDHARKRLAVWRYFSLGHAPIQQTTIQTFNYSLNFVARTPPRLSVPCIAWRSRHDDVRRSATDYKPRRHAQQSLEEYLRSQRPVYTFSGPLQREPVHAITRDYSSDEVPVELRIRQPLLGAIARLEGDWLVPALQDSGIINEEDIKLIRSHLHHAGFRKLLRRALGVNSKDTNWYRILQLFGWPEAAPPEEWQTSHPIRDRMENLMEKHPSVRKVFESFARFDAVRSEALSASYSDLMCALLSTAMMDT